MCKNLFCYNIPVANIIEEKVFTSHANRLRWGARNSAKNKFRFVYYCVFLGYCFWLRRVAIYNANNTPRIIINANWWAFSSSSKSFFYLFRQHERSFTWAIWFDVRLEATPNNKKLTPNVRSLTSDLVDLTRKIFIVCRNLLDWQIPQTALLACQIELPPP